MLFRPCPVCCRTRLTASLTWAIIRCSKRLDARLEVRLVSEEQNIPR